MRALIAAAIARSRASLMLLLFLFAAGISAYLVIPKEANPDVAIPMMYVSMSLDVTVSAMSTTAVQSIVMMSRRAL